MYGYGNSLTNIWFDNNKNFILYHVSNRINSDVPEPVSSGFSFTQYYLPKTSELFVSCLAPHGLGNIDLLCKFLPLNTIYKQHSIEPIAVLKHQTQTWTGHAHRFPDRLVPDTNLRQFQVISCDFLCRICCIKLSTSPLCNDTVYAFHVKPSTVRHSDKNGHHRNRIFFPKNHSDLLLKTDRLKRTDVATAPYNRSVFRKCAI